MNRTYRLVWNERLAAFIPAPEIARARGKRTSGAVLLAVALASPAVAADLPTGGEIVGGSGSITQAGTTMTVTQATERLAANWQSFSIGEHHAVTFVQPSSSSIALNRVLGSDVSLIQGTLTANGQVFLVNPNGVLFTPTAQVEVGGLVASTLDITNEDFLNDRLRFEGETTNAIVNQGSIKVAPGGTAALLAARIENSGTIEAEKGNVLLGAGRAVTLDLGGPVKIEVEEGALEALITQGGAIKADGGLVYLTAQAADALSSAAINHTGLTEAKTLATNEKGEIYLLADMMHGEVHVAGTLDASGGFVETSAAKVTIADGAQVKAGHWLIDPTDITVDAAMAATLQGQLTTGNATVQTQSTGSGNGDITVNADLTWTSGHTLTLSAHRNIDILATLDASQGSGGKVVLEYGQGTSNGVIDGKEARYHFGLTGSGFTGRINLQAGDNFSTKLGSNGTPIDYTVITSLGVAGDASTTTLQGMKNSLSGNYVLGADIDASATSTWNGGAGFAPVGTFNGRFDGLGHTIAGLTINRPGTNMAGLFGGTQNARIQNVGLTGGSVTGRGYVGGLVGYNYSSTVSNSYSTGSVLGNWDVGGLVGDNYSSTVSNSYSTGSVSGDFEVGGLVGYNWDSTVSDSYATGDVEGSGDSVGGLVGYNNSSTVSNSHATGSVTGIEFVGGLVGANRSSSTVTNSYATGSVTGIESVGGLVGRNDLSTVTNSFWDTETSNQDTSAGGEGKTTAQMKDLATFTGWDISDVGGEETVWRLYEGESYPLLRHFLTPLTVAASGSREYDGTTNDLGVNYSTMPTAALLGMATVVGVTSKNVGEYTLTVSGLYSTSQSGYDISYAPGTLRITPKVLTISDSHAADKIYDGTTTATVIAGVLYGLVDDESLGITASGTFADKDAGTNKDVTVSYLLANGANGGLASNYTLAGETLAASITPKTLTIAGSTAADKVYDGAATASVAPGTLHGLVGAETLAVSATGTFADENAGTGKAVTVSYTLADGANGGLASNYALNGETLIANITPRPVTVAADTKGKTEGAPDPMLTYTTGCPAGQMADCGLVAGETLAGSLIRDAGESAGTYVIRQGTVHEGNNRNYAITYVGAELTIAAAGSGGGSSGGGTSGANHVLSAAIASAQNTGGGLPGTLGGDDGFGSDGEAPSSSTDVLIRAVSTGIRLPEGVLPDDKD